MAKESNNGNVAEVAPQKAAFALPNKKVKLVPVIKKGWLPSGHAAEFLFQNAMNTITLPRSSRTGAYINPFTSEEQSCIENHPQLSFSEGDLSVHKTTNNYWKTKKGIGGFKPIKLGKDEITLDLSDPMDYITRSVLLANKDLVAPDARSARGKASYKYMIVDLEYEDEKLANEATLAGDAYGEFNKIREDKDSLSNVLFLLKNVRVSPSSKLEWLVGEVGKIVQKSPKRFLDIVKDEDMQIKLLIGQGIAANAILRDGTIYRTAGGDLMGKDNDQAVAFIKNDSNSDLVSVIRHQVDKANNK